MDFLGFEDSSHTVYVEHCLSCEKHLETTRHVVEFRCVSAGCGFTAQHQKDWDEHVTRHRLVGSHESTKCNPQVITKYDRYFEMFEEAVRNQGSNIQVYANAHCKPRIGSFEIYFLGSSGKKTWLFSKLKTKAWPKVEVVASRVKLKLREEHIGQLEIAIVRYQRHVEDLNECFFGHLGRDTLNAKCSREDFIGKVRQRKSLEALIPALVTSLKGRSSVSWEAVLLVMLRLETQASGGSTVSRLSGPRSIEELQEDTTTNAEPRHVGTTVGVDQIDNEIARTESTEYTKSTRSIGSLDIDYELRPNVDAAVETVPSMPSEKARFDEVPSEVSYQSSIASEVTGEYSDDFD